MFIPFGVVQDILDTVDIDAVVEIMSGEQSDNDTDIVIALAPAIIGAMKEIKPILLDIFPDVTEEELRLCDTREICRVVVDILALAIKTMFKPADAKKKNKKPKKNRR